MSGQTDITIYSEEFLERIKGLKEDIHRKYVDIGAEPTPEFDGKGRKIIEQRPDGKDYIIEAYMRKKLDQYFPGWSWEQAAPLHFLGSEWVVAQGHLVIPDEYLLAFGIVPPLRRFYGVDSVRIQYKKEVPHTPDNIIDVGDNCKQANTAAFKYAINRLTNIGDDVYGKRIEEEGAGSLEQMLEFAEGKLDTTTQAQLFNKFVQQRHLRISQVCQMLGVKDFSEIKDYGKALKCLKEKV